MNIQQKDLVASKYMIRKRPWIAKGEIVRCYYERKDIHNWNVFVEDETKFNADE